MNFFYFQVHAWPRCYILSIQRPWTGMTSFHLNRNSHTKLTSNKVYIITPYIMYRYYINWIKYHFYVGKINSVGEICLRPSNINSVYTTKQANDLPDALSHCNLKAKLFRYNISLNIYMSQSSISFFWGVIDLVLLFVKHTYID